AAAEDGFTGNAADWGGGWGAAPPAPIEPERPVWGPATAVRPPAPQASPQPAPQQPAPQPSPQQPAPQASPQPSPQPAPQEAARQAAAPVPAASGQIEMIRRAWPEILDELSSIRRVTWMNVSANASPAGFDGAVLALGFKNQGSATNFERGDHAENLRRAIHKVLGVDCQIRTVDGSSMAAGESGPKAPISRPEPAGTPERQQPARPGAPTSAPAPEKPAPVAAAQPPAQQSG
ncbi:DNA polymerase III subunit gamma and tau, partial [Arthrobacter sp. GCM10027362]